MPSFARPNGPIPVIGSVLKKRKNLMLLNHVPPSKSQPLSHRPTRNHRSLHQNPLPLLPLNLLARIPLPRLPPKTSPRSLVPTASYCPPRGPVMKVLVSAPIVEKSTVLSVPPSLPSRKRQTTPPTKIPPHCPSRTMAPPTIPKAKVVLLKLSTPLQKNPNLRRTLLMLRIFNLQPRWRAKPLHYR
jgi:hypothetical protein